MKDECISVLYNVHVAGCVDGERVCQLQQRPLPRPPPAASSCSRLIDPLSLHYDKQQKPLGQVCLSFSVCLSLSFIALLLHIPFNFYRLHGKGCSLRE